MFSLHFISTIQILTVQADANYIRELMDKEHGSLDVQTKDAILDDEEKRELAAKLADPKLHEFEQMDGVLRCFKHILCTWGSRLNSRSAEEKQSNRLMGAGVQAIELQDAVALPKSAVSMRRTAGRQAVDEQAEWGPPGVDLKKTVPAAHGDPEWRTLLQVAPCSV
uniref:FH2 domain-containing protein n=1 Tax=Macrostomum lignano TaxID=282301 RepID=A0A1I8FUA4_9PLAT